MVSRCNCYWSGTRCRFAANPARVPIPTCPRRASSRPSGCPTRWRASRSPAWSAARSGAPIQTAQPVADALGLTIDIDDRLAEYDRDLTHYIPIEQIAAEYPEELARLASGHLPSSVDEDAFLARINAGIRDIVAAGDHEDTVAVFSHGGVINGLLHSILRTEKMLCVNVDYAGVTRLLSSRDGRPLRRRGQRHRTRMGPAAAKSAVVDKSGDYFARRASTSPPWTATCRRSASRAAASCGPS